MVCSTTPAGSGVVVAGLAAGDQRHNAALAELVAVAVVVVAAVGDQYREPLLWPPATTPDRR